VSDVASRTQGLQLSATAQAQLLTNSQDAHDSYSGVNLDEEAANLMRFQQAYQASAKIIAAASQLFDVLLNATGG
jgi:flagellar hook-associated protein 1 FlgK